MQLRVKLLSIEEFGKEVLENPAYRNELAYFKKFFNRDGEMRYRSMSDFYSDIIDMFIKISSLQAKGLLTIGLNDLLKEKKSNKEER